jgi:hypothetical protein
MSTGEAPFNPLDKITLGLTVAKAMLDRPTIQMPISTPFSGAGIYAIYYVGTEYPSYGAIAARNTEGQFAWPIYVGKAVPAGGRKGILKAPGKRAKPSDAVVAGPLFKRLAEHSESIEQAENLDIASFLCRYLVVDDIWIPLGESLLINELRPIWNLVIDGFGNHDPGAGRRKQRMSSWDALHRGRPWAAKQRRSKRTVEQILENLRAFIAGHPGQSVEDQQVAESETDMDG